MKKILNVLPNRQATDWALLIARVGIGALMLTHGLPKLQMLLSGGGASFPSVLGLGGSLSLALAVFAEVFCSLLLILGLGTRLAVLPLIATMLVAVFMVHAADPFSKQEPGLQFLLVYVVLLLMGSGRYSVDYLLHRRLYHATAENTKPAYA